MISHTATTHAAGPRTSRQAAVAYRVVSPLYGIRMSSLEQTGLLVTLPAGARFHGASFAEPTGMVHIQWRGEGFLVFSQDLRAKAEEE